MSQLQLLRLCNVYWRQLNALPLQLPLALEHTTQRKQALVALTDLLTGAAGKSTLDAQVLQQALLCLTAREVVQLLDWQEVAKAPRNALW